MLRVSWRAMLLCACVLGVVTLGLGLMQATHLDRRFSKQFKYSREHRTPQHQEPRLGGQADLQKTRGAHPAPRPLEVMEDRLEKRIKESKRGSIDGMRWLGEDNEIIDQPQVKGGGNDHKRGAKEPGKQRPCLNIKECSKKELQGLLDYTDSPKGLSWWDPTLPPVRTPAGLCEGRGSCEGEGGPNDTPSLLLDYLLQGTDARLMVSDVQNELDSVLIKHFDRLPQMSVSSLSSGCVSEKLLLSLSGDRVFWESRSLESILELVHRTETNGIALVRLVQETRRKMKL